VCALPISPEPLTRDVFGERYRRRFHDPAFEREREAIARLEEIAWQAYQEGRKAPRTRKAGEHFADPTFDLSIEWLSTRDRLRAAQARWGAEGNRSRLLLVNGSARNDGTCPGEISKSWRLTRAVRDMAAAEGVDTDVLDLSLVTSEFGRQIHPCKGCVSTAMPLCHWPCSCYPNHALGQADDWMAEIYERWVAAHGVVIVAPTYWYQSPSPLKLMIDRLVCADGGNPDPTTTHGKRPDEAKGLEAAGWGYPKHLAGRTYGVVHGDVAGVESHRRNLTDWLDWMGLVDAGAAARLDRYVGDYEPYATSHDALDRDTAFLAEVRNVAHAVTRAIARVRTHTPVQPGEGLSRPRPK